MPRAGPPPEALRRAGAPESARGSHALTGATGFVRRSANRRNINWESAGRLCKSTVRLPDRASTFGCGHGFAAPKHPV